MNAIFGTITLIISIAAIISMICAARQSEQEERETASAQAGYRLGRLRSGQRGIVSDAEWLEAKVMVGQLTWEELGITRGELHRLSAVADANYVDRSKPAQ